MLARWTIRFVSSLVGVALGIGVADIVLDDFSIDAAAMIQAVLLFWIVHIVVQFLALRILIRQPSVALAGLLALASTVVALIVVNIVVSGLSISGASTYIVATLIIWIATAIGDLVGHRMIRSRREDRRS